MNFKSLPAFFAGIIFSMGLMISQMVNPNKVLNFLDVSGNWDPSLLFVMGSALSIYWIGYFLVKPKLAKPLLEGEFDLPVANNLNRSLSIGAMLFGLGWGLTGLCPGPAIANITGGSALIVLYVVAMCLTMFIYGKLSK